MKDCKKSQDLFVQALYDELDASQSQFFSEHLKFCKQCAEEFQKMKSALKMIDERRFEHPADTFWESFSDQVQARLQQEERRQKKFNVSGKISDLFGAFPQWGYQIAAAVLLIAAGFFVGKFYYGSEAVQGTGRNQPMAAIQNTQQNPAVNQAAYDYIETSKILLLGIVNIDPTADSSGTFDFSRQREVARNLVQKAAYLKEDLHSPQSRKLKALVGELELILLQIANLEAKTDLPAIELIRSGVDRKGLLLRINLEKMQRETVNEKQIKSKETT